MLLLQNKGRVVGCVMCDGKQGWRSGESTCVGSRPCSERFFSGYSGLPSPQ